VITYYIKAGQAESVPTEISQAESVPTEISQAESVPTEISQAESIPTEISQAEISQGKTDWAEIKTTAESRKIMENAINREQALALLKKYNKEPFHIYHGLTVEGTMRWFARELGYGEEEEFWGLTGLLHDIDFELYPDQHCTKAPELLRAGGCSEDMIHAICSHGYKICCDVEPVHEMEKVLYTVDELTGLIGAAARMRPSKSVSDMEVKSIKKKFKDKRFAAGCSRDIIIDGAAILGWELDDVFEKTILAMRSCEEQVNRECPIA
jgi:predicted hydrolase (HD superfamily)